MSTKAKTNHRRKKAIIISAIMASLLIIIGITVAWFYQQQKAASLTKIAPPGEIIISGVHGSQLDQIDLSYSNGDIDENKTVTVRNVICVDSAAKNITLKLAHTTNVDNLSFRIYPATETTSQPGSGEYVKGSDSGTDYYYTFDPKTGYTTKEVSDAGDKMILMACLNADENNLGLAKKDGNYHENTYGANETRVQNQAEPLYWISTTYTLPLDSKTDVNAHIKYEHYGYFVLEASWKEQDKETDIVYVTADGAA